MHRYLQIRRFIKKVFPLLKIIYSAIPISERQRIYLKNKIKNFFFCHIYSPNPSDKYSELILFIQFYKQNLLSKVITINSSQMLFLDDSQLEKKARSLVFHKTQNPIVSILIPVYNNIKLTLECLVSIEKNTKIDGYEIIVVDDASTDSSQEILSLISGIKYLRNKQNIGFLRTCNMGLKYAKGNYIIFLNNDVQVTENWLSPLLNIFSLYPDTGAVAPKVIFPDGRLQEAGAKINRDATTKFIGHFDDPNKPRYNYIREVDYCSACCLMLKTEMFKKLGGFNLSFIPAYSEDVDLCLRVQKQELKIRYQPNSVIIHHLNATMSKSKEKNKLAVRTRNQQKLSLYWQKEIDDLNQVKLISYFNFANNANIKKETELAKHGGIYGFAIQLNTCDEHFLEQNFPFCFYISEFSRSLLIEKKEILEKLFTYFTNKNYLTVYKKPLLIIDQFDSFQNLKEITESIRRIFKENRLGEILLLYKESNQNILDNIGDYGIDFIITSSANKNPTDYKKILINDGIIQSNSFLSVKTSFGGGAEENTYDFYRAWLQQTIQLTLEQKAKEERIIFIDKWPSDHHYQFLEATKNALDYNYLLP